MANMDMNVDTYAVERGAAAIKNAMVNVQRAVNHLIKRVEIASERFNDPNYVQARDAVMRMRDGIKHVYDRAEHIDRVAKQLCKRVEAYNETTYKE